MWENYNDVGFEITMRVLLELHGKIKLNESESETLGYEKKI
jgi:hypothetical protein